MDVVANRSNRGGRPRKADARRKQVMVRLSEAERAQLDEIAGPRGVAEYLRAVGLRRRPRIPRLVPEANAEIWRELAPTLANLNQLTRLANGGVSVSESLLTSIQELRRHVVLLRAELLGQEPRAVVDWIEP